ncbi:MAG: hypothetical protein MUE30_11150 [Spirosomaceae bacterium]|jgi:hypothetical protein|nr:hypothetical protein [Spirosomataceae bacterium]
MFKNPTFAAVFTTAYLFVYTIVTVNGWAPNTSLALFLFSPVLVLWLVYTVLRYGEPSGRTFEEYFYDDVNIRTDKWRN